MKFKEYGEFRTDLEEEIVPKELLERRISSIDYLLCFLREKEDEFLHIYLSNLRSKFQNLIIKKFKQVDEMNIKKILEKTEILKDVPELVKDYFKLCLQLLEIEESIQIDETIKLPERNFLRAYLIPRYYFLSVLTETIEREKAIEYYKEQMNQYCLENASKFTQIANLEELCELYIKQSKEGGIIRIIGDIEDGKLIVRKDSCTWYHAIKDLEDRELIYYAICYGDIPVTSAMNKNFVLTRDYTIAEGFSYCDEVTHDTRINENIEHPSKEFFDNIWPVKIRKEKRKNNVG